MNKSLLAKLQLSIAYLLLQTRLTAQRLPADKAGEVWLHENKSLLLWSVLLVAMILLLILSLELTNRIDKRRKQ